MPSAFVVVISSEKYIVKNISNDEQNCRNKYRFKCGRRLFRRRDKYIDDRMEFTLFNKTEFLKLFDYT